MSECQNIGYMKGALFPVTALHFHAESHARGLSLQDAPLKIFESSKSYDFIRTLNYPERNHLTLMNT